ncbi:hypothetical protein, partial [Pseudomonas syringae]|uniref:hypothetical protein n=1 Tax=Pseudomonas syringae TaxID=317 RepID=UPI001F1F42D1
CIFFIDISFIFLISIELHLMHQTLPKQDAGKTRLPCAPDPHAQAVSARSPIPPYVEHLQ